MSVLGQTLLKVSANRFVQGMLASNVHLSQYLMGVGSGGGVKSSGERAMFGVLRQRSKPPYCIFDVGANKGQFLKLTLDNIGVKDFTVHCFEPGQGTFRELVAGAGVDQRVRLNNFGLGKESGAAQLYYDEVGSGLASLTKRRLDHFEVEFDQAETVVIRTIDSYCQEHGVDRIDLLKIDIEGHELDALAGAQQMLEKKAIDIVSFEFGGCNIDTRTYFQDFWYFFHQAGFDLLRITPSGYLHPLGAYQEIDVQFRTTNFLAVARRDPVAA